MHLFHTVLGGMENSVDPDQITPSGSVSSGSALFAYVCFMRKPDVRKFKTVTMMYI